MAKPKILKKSNFQRGKSNLPIDKQYKALPPGKRLSSNGKVYYETRKNRSDMSRDEWTTQVKKHTRENGKVKVESHDRTIKSKPVSQGSDMKPMGQKPELTSSKDDSKISNLDLDKKIKGAKLFGIMARRKGLERIPARDENLKNLIVGVPIGEAKPIMKSWLDGWDENDKLKKELRRDDSQMYKGYYIHNDLRNHYYYIKKKKDTKRYLGVEFSLEKAKEYIDNQVKEDKQDEEIKKDISKVIKKGDLFYTSWGYDQTNYDFLIVKKVSPTGKTAICQMAEYENIGYSGQSHIQKPKRKGFGKEFRMQIRINANRVTLVGSYPYVQSSSRRDTFSKASKDQTFYETDSQFGH